MTLGVSALTSEAGSFSKPEAHPWARVADIFLPLSFNAETTYRLTPAHPTFFISAVTPSLVFSVCSEHFRPESAPQLLSGIFFMLTG